MEQKQPIYQWLDVDGNNTLAVDYPLDENSWVIDLGGYHGVWASQMLEKYNSNIILIEPVPEFYAYLRNKFKGVSKVTVLNFGVSAERTSGTLFLRADGTSKYIETENPIIVQFLTLQDILDMAGKEHIDFLQINIEGEEYDLLEQMLEDGLILKFQNIQIQYHDGVKNYVERRLKIQERMSEWFTKMYDYPFVFEGWKRKEL